MDMDKNRTLSNGGEVLKSTRQKFNEKKVQRVKNNNNDVNIVQPN